MTAPDEDAPTPRLHLVAFVWAGAGAVALVVALVTTSVVVAVFGGLALLAGGTTYALQTARERSEETTRRTVPRPSGDDPGTPPVQNG